MLFVALGSVMVYSFREAPIKGTKHSSQKVLGTKPINKKTSTVPYNGCGGGCVSNNSRCCGTCSVKGKGCGPDEYMCVRIQSLGGSYRLECWHFGPSWSLIGNAFGIDVDNAPISNCSYFRIRKELNNNLPIILDSNEVYNSESTVVGWDPISDSNFVSLKYHFDFYNSGDSLLTTQTYIE